MTTDITPSTGRGTSTILVPIRYPIGDASARTLVEAGRLAEERSPATLVALHVNLIQYDEGYRTQEMTSAISAVLEDVEAAVVTRRGFIVEEVILEEADQLGADVVVLGANRRSRWRRLLRRLTGNDPDIGSYLRTNTDAGIDVVEIDTQSETTPPDGAVSGD